VDKLGRAKVYSISPTNRVREIDTEKRGEEQREREREGGRKGVREGESDSRRYRYRDLLAGVTAFAAEKFAAATACNALPIPSVSYIIF
jgi:hypothetical protein